MNPNQMNPLFRKFIALVLAFTMVFTGTVAPGIAGLTGSEAYAAEADGWYWEDSTLYIKDGEITKASLYSALHEKINNTKSGYRYSDTNFSRGTQWASGGTEVKSDTSGDANLAEGTWYIRNAGTFLGSASYSAGSTTTITVKHYYILTAAVADGSPDDGGISLSATKVISGNAVEITVNSVTGYTATVKDSDNNAITNLSAYNPTKSTTLTVYYENKPTHTVSLNVQGESFGSVTLSRSGAVPEGETITVTATPETNGYVSNITVSGASFTDNGFGDDRKKTGSFTVESSDITVTVTFAEKNLAGVAEADVKVNPNKLSMSDADNLEAMQKAIFEAVVDQDASLPSGVKWDDLTYKFYSVGKATGNYDSEALELTGNKTLYYYFGERGLGVEEKILITWPGNEQYPEKSITAEITLVEGREAAVIGGQTSYTQAVPFESSSNNAIIEEIRKVATINGEKPSDTSVFVITLADNQKLPEGGETKQLTYNVSVEDGTDYLEGSGTVTIWVTSDVGPASINVTSESGTVVIKDASENIVNGSAYAGTLTFTITPNSGGYYVEKVTINGTKVTETYFGTVFSGEFTVENEKEYDFVVTYGQRTLTAVENPAIDYNFYYDVSDKAADVKEELINDVLIATGGTVTADQITVYVYNNTTNVWYNITGEGIGNLADGTFNAASEDLRIVWSGDDQHPEVTFEVKVTVNDTRTTVPNVRYTGKGFVVDSIDDVTTDAVLADIKHDGVNVNTVSVVKKSGDFPEVEGATNNFVYTVTIEENENYKTTVVDVEVPVTNLQHLTTVTYSDTDNSEAKLMKDGKIIASGSAVESGEYSFVVTPTGEGYAVENVTVDDTTGAIAVLGTETWAKTVYTIPVTITNNATSETSITLTQSTSSRSIPLNTTFEFVSYNPELEYDTQKDALLSAVKTVALSDTTYADQMSVTRDTAPTVGQKNDFVITWAADEKFTEINEIVSVDVKDARGTVTFTQKENVLVDVDCTDTEMKTIEDVYAYIETKLAEMEAVTASPEVSFTYDVVEEQGLTQGQTQDIKVNVIFTGNKDYQAKTQEMTFSVKCNVKPAKLTINSIGNGTTIVSETEIENETKTINVYAADLELLAVPTPAADNLNNYVYSVMLGEDNAIEGTYSLNKDDDYQFVNTEKISVADGSGKAWNEEAGSYTITVVYGQRSIVAPETATYDFNPMSDYAGEIKDITDALFAGLTASDVYDETTVNAEKDALEFWYMPEDGVITYYKGSDVAKETEIDSAEVAKINELAKADWKEIGSEELTLEGKIDDNYSYKIIWNAFGFDAETQIKVVYPGTEPAVDVYDVTDVTLTDPRSEGEIDLTKITFETIEFDTIAEIQTEVEKVLEGKGLQAELTNEKELSLEKDGEEQTAKYTLTLPETEDYTEATANVEVKVIGRVHNAKVTLTDDEKGNVSITGTDGEDNTVAIVDDETTEGTVNAKTVNNVLTVTADPTEDAPYYVKSVTVTKTVTDAEGKVVSTTDPVAVDGSYSKQSFTGTIDVENGDYGAEVTYNVAVEYALHSIPLKDSYEDAFYNPLSEDENELNDAVKGVVLNDSSIASQITVEWVKTGEQTGPTLNEDNTFLLTWAESDKYPEVTANVTVKLTDERGKVQFTDNNVTIDVDCKDADLQTEEALNAYIKSKLEEKGAVSVSAGANPPTYEVVSGQTVIQGQDNEIKFIVTSEENTTYQGDSAEMTVTVKCNIKPAELTIKSIGNGTTTVADTEVVNKTEKINVYTAELELSAVPGEPTTNALRNYVYSVMFDNDPVDGEYALNSNGDYRFSNTEEIKVVDGTGKAWNEPANAYTISVVYGQKQIGVSEDEVVVDVNPIKTVKEQIESFITTISAAVTISDSTDADAADKRALEYWYEAGEGTFTVYNEDEEDVTASISSADEAYLKSKAAAKWITLNADTLDENTTQSGTLENGNKYQIVWPAFGAGKTENVKVVWPESDNKAAVYVEKTVSVNDPRDTRTINITAADFGTIEFDTVEEIAAAVEKVIADKKIEGVEITLNNEISLDKDGETQTANYTLTIPEDADYKVVSTTVDITVKGKVHPATVVLSDHANGTVSVTGTDSEGKAATVVDSSDTDKTGTYEVAVDQSNKTLTITAAPTEDGYYVESVAVTKTVGNGGEPETVEIANPGYEDLTYTGTIDVENGDYGAEVTYSVAVTFAQRTIPLNDSYDTVTYNPEKPYADQEDALNDAVEATVLGDTSIADEISVEWLGCEATEGEDTEPQVGKPNQFRVTWTGNEQYPTVSVDVTVTVEDARGTVRFTNNNVTHKIDCTETIEDLDSLIEAKLAENNAVTVSPEDAEGTVTYNVTEGQTLIQGQNNTIEATVTFEETEEYQGKSETMEFTVYCNAKPAELTIVSKGAGTTTVTNIADNATVTNGSIAAANLKVTAAPTATDTTVLKNYVHTVTVTKPDATSEEPALSYAADYTATSNSIGIADGTGDEWDDPAKTYTITVVYGQKAIEAKEDASVSLNPKKTVEEQLDSITDQILVNALPANLTYDGETASADKDDLTFWYYAEVEKATLYNNGVESSPGGASDWIVGLLEGVSQPKWIKLDAETMEGELEQSGTLFGSYTYKIKWKPFASGTSDQVKVIWPESTGKAEVSNTNTVTFTDARALQSAMLEEGDKGTTEALEFNLGEYTVAQICKYVADNAVAYGLNDATGTPGEIDKANVTMTEAEQAKVTALGADERTTVKVSVPVLENADFQSAIAEITVHVYKPIPDATFTTNASGSGTGTIKLVDGNKVEYTSGASVINGTYSLVVTPATGSYVKSITVSQDGETVSYSYTDSASYKDSVFTDAEFGIDNKEVATYRVEVEFGDKVVAAIDEQTVSYNPYSGTTAAENAQLAKTDIWNKVVDKVNSSSEVNEETLESGVKYYYRASIDTSGFSTETWVRFEYDLYQSGKSQEDFDQWVEIGTTEPQAKVDNNYYPLTVWGAGGVGSTEQVKIEWAGDSRYPTASDETTVTLVDPRGQQSATYGSDKTGYDADHAFVYAGDVNVAAICEYVANNVEEVIVSGTGTLGQVAVENVTMAADQQQIIADMAEKTTTSVKVSVTVPETADFKEATVDITIWVYKPLPNATYKTSVTGSGTVSLTDANGTAYASGASLINGDYTLVAAPTAGYYVDSISVNGTDLDVSLLSGKYNADTHAYTHILSINNETNASYEVVVKFAEKKINLTANQTIRFNPAKTVSDQLDDIKSDILDVVVGNETDVVNGKTLAEEAKYYYWASLDTSALSDSAISTINGILGIGGSSLDSIGQWVEIGAEADDYTVGSWTISYYQFGDNATEKIKVEWAGDDRFPTVAEETTVKLEDPRVAQTATVNVGKTAETAINLTEIADLAAYIEENTTVSATTNDTGKPEVTSIELPTDMKYDVPAEATITIKLPATESCKEVTETHKVWVVTPVPPATIDVAVEGNVGGKVIISNSALDYSVEGTTFKTTALGGTYQLTVQPEGNYYVESVVIDGTPLDVSYANGKYAEGTINFVNDVTFANDTTYDIDVKFAERTITLKDAPYNVGMNLDQKASEQVEKLQDNIIEAVIGEVDPTGDYTIEFYQNGISGFGAGWTTLDDSLTSQTLLDLSFNDATEQIRITYNGYEKYPSVTTGEITINIVDDREEAGLKDATFTHKTVDINTVNVDFVKEKYDETYNPNGLDVTITETSRVVDQENMTATVTFSVTYEADDNYLAGSATVTVNVTLLDPSCFIEVGINDAEKGKVYANNVEIVGTLAADEEVSVKVVPVDGQAVKNITVKNGDEVVQTSDIAYTFEKENAVAEGTVTFTPDGSNGGVTYTVHVEYEDAKFTFDDPREFGYLYGIDDAPTATEVYDAIVVAPTRPDAATDYDATLKYLARPAGEYVINIPELSALGITFYEGGEYTVQLEDLWLEPGAEIEEFDINAEIEALKAQLAAVDEISLSNIEKLGKYVTDFLDSLPKKHIGAHYFGQGGDGSVETVQVSYNDGKYIIGETITDLTIIDNRTKTEISGNDATVVYGFTEEELKAAMNLSVIDGDGNVVADSTNVYFVTKAVGLDASSTAYEIKVAFDGDADNQPCTATFKVTVNKAPCSIDYDSQIVTWGDDYEFELVKNPEDVDTINLLIGLDFSQISKTDYIPVTDIHIQLPESLGLLNNLLAGDHKLADLIDILEGLANTSDTILEAMGISSDTIETILNTINSVTEGMENAGEIMIHINGDDIKPDNVGVYLAGAITADSNYETDYALDYLVIVPKTTEAELEYRFEDSNGIITQNLIEDGLYDLGADAFVENIFNEEATDDVGHLFLKVDTEGNVNLIYADSNDDIKTHVESGELTEIGAYGQLSFILDIANEMYMATPIVRAYAVISELVDVQFIDENGEETDSYTYTFDGTNENRTPDVRITDSNGDEVSDEHLTINYYGYSLNNPAEIYKSTEPPTDAGVYTVVAIYADMEDEVFGADVAAYIVRPAEAEIDVENQSVVYGSDYDLGVTVAPEDCKYTTIVAGIDASGQITDNPLSMFSGTVNIDFPTRIDNVLKELMPSAYSTGIAANDILTQVDRISEELSALGIQQEVVDTIVSVLNMIPETELGNVKVTFKDDVVPQNIGLYLVGAVTTDPNYEVAMDLGYLIVQPETKKVDLAFNYVDDNLMITSNYIKNGIIDLGSHVVPNDEVSEEIAKELTDTKLHNLYIGVDADGNFIVTTEPQSAIGAYTQLAFLLDEGNEMYYAEPIMRAYIVVPESVDVEFIDENGDENNDRTFTYDGQPHGMDVRVTHNDGTVLPNDEHLTVRYIGVDAKGIEFYNSEEPPTNVGAYTVIATYADEEADLYGLAIGAMVIEPADAAIDVKEGTYLYDEDYTFQVETTPEGVEHITIVAGMTSGGDIIDGEVGMVNIDFPDRFDGLLERIVPGAYTDGVNLANVIEELENIKAIFDDLGIEHSIIDQLKGVIDQVMSLIDQIAAQLGLEPGDINVTFKETETIKPVPLGTYIVAGITADVNYEIGVMDYGMVIITDQLEQKEIKVILDDMAKVYGEDDPAFTYEITGELLDGDTYEDIVKVGEITRQAGEDAGDYTIIAVPTFADETKDVYYDITIIPGTLTITQAENAWTDELDIEGWTYGGNANEPSAKAKYGEVKYKFYDAEGNVVEDITKADAGEYTVVAYVEETADYAGLTSDPYEFEIAKMQNQWNPELSMEGWAYDEAAKEPVVGAKYGNVVVKYYANEACTTEIEKPSMPGTYYVKATVAEGTNYTGLEGEVVEFTITKAANEWTTPLTMENWTFGEPAKAPSAEAKYGTDTVVYTYCDADGNKLDEKPTSAGAYTVKATVAETETYTGLEDVVEFTIAKASNSWTTGLSIVGWVYGEFDETKNLPVADAQFGGMYFEYFADAECTVDVYDVANAEVGTYYVRACVEGTDDYAGLVSDPVAFNITQAQNEWTTKPGIQGWIYDKYDAAVNAPYGEAKAGEETFKYFEGEACTKEIAASDLAKLPVGTYYMKAYASETRNYTALVSDAIPFFVSQTANAWEIGVSIEGWVYGQYNEDVNAPKADAQYGEVVFTYYDADGNVVEDITTADAGKYTVVASVAATEEYSGLSASAEFIIKQAPNAWTTELGIEGWTYGETAIEPFAEAEHGEVTYKYFADEACEDEIAAPTNAGTYYVKAYVEESNNYAGLESDPVKFVIAKADNEWTKELSMKGWVYGDPENEPSAEAKVGEVTYKYFDAEGNELSGKPTSAGTYNVKAYVAESENYKGLESEAVEFVIEKANNSWVVRLDIEDWTYGETASEPYAEAKAGEVTYKYFADKEGKQEIEKPVNAGTYYVKAYVAETENYNGLESRMVTFHILKAENEWVASLSIQGWVVGEPANEPTAEAKYNNENVTYKYFADKACTKEIGVPSEVGTYYVKAFVPETDNYTGLTSKAVSFVISATANKWIEELSIKGWTYGDEPNKPFADAKYGDVTYKYYADVECTKEIDEPTDAGTYYVKAFVEATEEYGGLESEAVEFTIAPKADADLSVDEIADQSYTGSEITPAVVVKDGDKVLVEGKDYTVEYKDNVEVGTATIVITGIGNYDGYTDNITFDIVPAQLPKAVLDYVKTTYSGLAKTPAVKVSGLFEGLDYEVLYKDNVEAGTATVVIIGFGNYTGTVELNFEIMKAENKWTVDLSIIDWVVGGTPGEPYADARFGEVTYMFFADEACTEELSSVDNLDAGRYYVKAYVAGTDNYTGLESEAVDFVVAENLNVWTVELSIEGWTFGQYDADKNAPKADAKYGEVVYKFYVDADCTEEIDADKLAELGAGTYYVKAFVEGTVNYNGLASDAVKFKVAKAENEWTKALTMDGWKAGEYNAEANAPNADAAYGEVVYKFYADADFTQEIAADNLAGLEAGRYYVKAFVEEGDNYTGLESKTVVFLVAGDGSGEEAPDIPETPGEDGDDSGFEPEVPMAPEAPNAPEEPSVDPEEPVEPETPVEPDVPAVPGDDTEDEPEKPADNETPETSDEQPVIKPEDDDNDAPDTGDDNLMALWLGLVMTSMFGVSFGARRRRTKEE